MHGWKRKAKVPLYRQPGRDALPDLVKMTRKNMTHEQFNALPNGLLCLKGGDLTAEIKPYKRIVDEVLLNHYFKEPFFQTKKLVYLPMG